MANTLSSTAGRRGRLFSRANRSLLILVVTAFLCSRALFALFADPEGPNLLVVTVMAAILWGVSSAGYLSNFVPSLAGRKRMLAAIVLQMVVAAGFYFGLR